MRSFSRDENTSDSWRTPAWLIEQIKLFDSIGFDPCGHPQSLVGAEYQLLESDGFDGLVEPWSDMGLVFVNPPYGKALSSAWAPKIAGEADKGVEIILLCPARTDTKWFHAHVFRKAQAILFFEGRVNFINEQGDEIKGATFAPVLCYFGGRAARFAGLYQMLGKVVLL